MKTATGSAPKCTSSNRAIPKPVKISRAVLHGTADILTFGLWEAVGTPAELAFSGTDTMVLLTYNASDRVENVEYFKGGEQGE